MNEVIKKIARIESQPAILWLYATLSMISFSWFGSTSSPKAILIAMSADPLDFKFIRHADFLIPLFMFSLFAFCSFRIFIIGKVVFPRVKEVSLKRNPTESEVLICSLSTPWITPQNYGGKLALRFVRRAKNGDDKEHEEVEHFYFTDDLSKDIERLTELEKSGLRWNWTQLLRGMASHSQKINLLYLVTTEDSHKDGKESDGSHHYVDIAIKLISNYFAQGRIQILECSQRVNPEAIIVTHKTYSDLVDKIIDHHGYKASNIAIDITGGTKPMSIAGALSTLQNKVVFQYVATEGTKNEVIQFGLNMVTYDDKR